MALSPGCSYQGTSDQPSRGGTLLMLCLFVILGETQSIFSRFLAIEGVTPDLVVAAVVACGIFRGREQGFWLGMMGGLVQDLAGAGSSSLGQFALAKMTIGWFAGSMASSVRRTFILVPIVLIAFASVFNLFVVGFFTGSLVAFQWRTLAGAAFVNVMYGVPIYYFVGFLPGSTRS